MSTDWSSLTLYVCTTILSAFAGTSAAFSLERRKKEDDEKRTKLSAGNRAIFILSQQYNVLYTLKKQLIDPYRENPGFWINIPASLPRSHDDLRFHIGSLQFLLSSDNPNLLGELLTEEQRFFEALKTSNERSVLHREKLQPQLDALGIKFGDFVRSADLERTLGVALVGGLKTLTEAFIEHTEEGMKGLVNIYGKLADQLKKMLPGEKIIELRFPDAATKN